MSQKKSNLKLYRHYKNKLYKLLGEVRHSETLEELVLYETRYKNELGSLWVRPKNMFYEKFEDKGTSRFRFEQVKFRFESANALTDEHKDQITELLMRVFGSYDREKLETKLKDKNNILLIMAFDQKTFIGFKLGYELDDKTYYSWLGAIEPDYQGIGLGKELLELQHSWCEDKGYRLVKTKTMNMWKSMLFLNLSCGFLITSTETRSDGEIKILLEKALSTSR